MSRLVLILRPDPGASATAERARALGLTPVIAPLFEIGPLAWAEPAGRFDAVMITSANAVRFGGAGLASWLHLPCYAVGETSAAAARAAGFDEVRIGPSDGEELVEIMACDGIATAIHPCGADRIALGHLQVRIVDIPVYSADPVPELPAAAQSALCDGALVLLHSPRAAAHFAELVPQRKSVRIAAISPAAARAAGPGWASVHAADRPRDEALLELAAKLCQTAAK